MQAGINCGPSSQSDFIQIYFLLNRMFRFFRHPRQIPYFNISRQKVTHFSVLGQKSDIFKWDRGKRERKKREERERRKRKRKESGVSLSLSLLERPGQGMSGEWAGQGWLAWGSQSRPRWWRSTPSHASAPAWSRRLSPVWGTSSPRPKYIVVCTTTITIGNTDMGLITIHCKHHHLSEGISNAGMGFCRWCKRSDLHMQVLSQVLQVQYFLSRCSSQRIKVPDTWDLQMNATPPPAEGKR